MSNLLNLLEYIFLDLIRLSYLATFLILFILIIRGIFKNKVTVNLKYMLWFILITRLVLPVSFVSSFSFFNHTPKLYTYENLFKISTNEILSKTYEKISSQRLSKLIHQENPININLIPSGNLKNSGIITANKLLSFLSILWFVGALLMALAVIVTRRKFSKKLKSYEPIESAEILELLNESKKIIGINKNVLLLKTNDINTPAIFGIINPKILLPSKLVHTLNLEEMKYILFHELAHIRGKDMLINYIGIYLSIIYWFNPLIWYSFYKMNEDMEICCDSYALTKLKDKEVLDYGISLLNLAQLSSETYWLPGMVGMVSSKLKLKRRILNIKSFEKRSCKFSFIALAALLSVSSIFLTDVKAEVINTNSYTAYKYLKERVEDNIDYDFENDEKLIGKWETIGITKDIKYFNSSNEKSNEDLFIKNLVIFPKGKMAQPNVEELYSKDKIKAANWYKWTKGYIIHKNNKTASKYFIEEIQGQYYLFLENKGDNYIYNGLMPYYYVLKKIE